MNSLHACFTRIGTHSFRKGAANFVVGTTDGPDKTAVSLRIEHKLGGSDDVYIKPHLRTDKLIARITAGLDDTSILFSALPPHFDGSIKLCYEELIPLTALRKAEPNMKATFPYLIATMLYHWDWLLENLPSTHPFFTSKIYKSNFKRDCEIPVITGILRDEKAGMRAGGLPKIVLDLLGHHEIIDILVKQPDLICDRMVEKISSVDGVQVHNTEMLNRTFGQKLDEIVKKQEMIMERMQISSGSGENSNRSDPNAYKQFYWRGEYHNYPHDFKLPHVHSLIMWRLWLFGDGNNVTAPYRILRGEFMSPSLRVQLTRARKVMDFFRDKIGQSYEEITNLGPIQAENLFNEVYNASFSDVRFYKTMTYVNAYKHLLKISKKNNNKYKS